VKPPKQARSRKLHLLSDVKKKEFYLQNQGTARSVLWESDVDGGFMFGFTENYIRCKKLYDPSSVNAIEPVKLDILDEQGVFSIKSL
jgi:threonylcarbamoyladenosine tRNA methylthiotransferase MtaB